MKGFRISINIILAVQLVLLILMAILWPTVLLNGALANISSDMETSGDVGTQIGNAIGAGFAALFLVIFFFGLCIIFVIAALVNIIVIIAYNVRKYPNLGISIITLIFVNLPAGILMLVHRNIYLNNSKEEIVNIEE